MCQAMQNISDERPAASRRCKVDFNSPLTPCIQETVGQTFRGHSVLRATHGKGTFHSPPSSSSNSFEVARAEKSGMRAVLKGRYSFKMFLKRVKCSMIWRVGSGYTKARLELGARTTEAWTGWNLPLFPAHSFSSLRASC